MLGDGWMEGSVRRRLNGAARCAAAVGSAAAAAGSKATGRGALRNVLIYMDAL